MDAEFFIQFWIVLTDGAGLLFFLSLCRGWRGQATNGKEDAQEGEKNAHEESYSGSRPWLKSGGTVRRISAFPERGRVFQSARASF